MRAQKFSLKKRVASFSHAFSGIKTALKEEHNARIHLAAAALAVALSLFFGISAYEWIAVVFAIGLVFSMELANSAIENAMDFISPEKHDTIRKIKDMSAAAVLASALAALVIGLIIFLPKMSGLCSSN